MFEGFFGTMFFLVFFMVECLVAFAPIIFIIFIINTLKRRANNNYFKSNVVVNSADKKYIRQYKDVSKDKLDKFNTDDINVLKDYFYDKFLEFEKAYNNLDYNIMRMLSTEQLYHNYHTGITLDLKSGNKRIITDIEKKKVIIFELDSTIAKQIASVMIEVSYVNYKIDKKGYVISGSRNNKIIEKFEVEFRKDFERKEITKCPNCGASIVGNKCEFCRSVVKDVDFKINSIKRIVD